MYAVKIGANGELLSVDEENCVKYLVNSSTGAMEVAAWYKEEYDEKSAFTKTTGDIVEVIAQEEYEQEVEKYILCDNLKFRSAEEMGEYIYR